MLEVIRSFRIGIINLLGITVPGLLIMTFLSIGFALPVLGLIYQITDILFIATRNKVINLDVEAYLFFKENKVLLSIFFLIISYVVGYIIRLSSIDKLDRISGDHILSTMNNKKEKDCWPYTKKEGDVFPYNNYWKYASERGLDQIKELVKWGEIAEDDNTKKLNKRSKTHVNWMKLKILASGDSQLSAVVESNEAHVRLLFGTWYVHKSIYWIYGGIGICLIGTILNKSILTQKFIGWLDNNFRPSSIETNLMFSDIADATSPSYLLFIAINILLLVGIHWGKKKVQNFFHYQRVRELTHIVMCMSLVNEKKKSVTT